ncbi:MAG: L-threonylcarbamoyladenylate synthase [Hellea sp.]
MTSLSQVVDIIDQGGVCILPTETVYGIAALADDKSAIDRIYTLKGRGFDKPLAVCVRNLDAATRLAQIDEIAARLARKFWPGPLTLVLPAAEKILDTRCYQEDTIALRCPDIAWREHFTAPLALTSSNRSGEPAATTAQTDLEADAVLDTGPSRDKVPSTILLVKNGTLKCLRAGALKAENLSEFDIEWP